MQELLATIDNHFSEHSKVLHWGTSDASPSNYAAQLTEWLSEGKHGEMEYLSNHAALRNDPLLFFPEAQSAILFLHSYPTPIVKEAPLGPEISAYAHGIDYHFIMKDIIKKLEVKLLESDETIMIKAFVDSAPVNERELAVRAGLGWLGKNCALIHPKSGSQFFIGGFFINKILEKESRDYPDGCAACRKCIDACPTQALEGDRSIDARKCISYLTIEKKGPIDTDLQKQMGNHIFGCDICLQVCPWNKKHLDDNPEDTSPFLKEFTEWEQLLQPGGGFKSQFKNTPLYRAGRKKMLRNLSIAQENTRDAS